MAIFYFFLQSIPECVGLIAISLAVGRVPLRWGHILLGGIVVSIVTFIIRSFQFSFGLHLPIAIFLIFLLIYKSTLLAQSKIIIAVFSSFVILAVAELLISKTFFAITQMEPSQAFANTQLWSLVGLVQAILLMVIAVVIAHFRKPNEGAWKK
ncbi:MAG: hypothetical protein ACOX6E_03240 [Syntrophomonadaceae bacterium]|jgi:hypothetical protein